MKIPLIGITASALILSLFWSCSDNNSPNGPGGGGGAGVPRVTATAPIGGSVNVTTNSNISIKFSTAMNRATVEAAISAVPAIAGTFAWTMGDSNVIWNPGANLAFTTNYSVTVLATASSTGNRAMARDTVFSFTTVSDTGTSASVPVVLTTDPADLSIGVPVNTNISFVFNVPMNQGATQAALSANPAITGTMVWSDGDTKLTLILTSNLANNTQYNVNMSTGATSKLSVAMVAAKSISFRTGATIRPPTQIVGTIYRREDNSTIAGANVVLFNANTNSPLQRVFSTSN